MGPAATRHPPYFSPWTNSRAGPSSIQTAEAAQAKSAGHARQKPHEGPGASHRSLGCPHRPQAGGGIRRSRLRHTAQHPASRAADER